jgi:CAAX prenyl protease-like protein
MSSTTGPTLNLTPPPDKPTNPPRDDLAYIAPMGVFLAFVWIAAHWPSLYAPLYVVKTVTVAVLLAYFWKRYTTISWNYWWLGIIVGVVGIVQWVGMQLLLQRYLPAIFQPPKDPFNPQASFASSSLMWSWIFVRIAGAALVVPVMEELFWRDFLWRTILAPNDFKLAAVGEWDWKAFLGVAGAFALVHGNWWLTSIVWALMIGWLLVRRKSLGACIVAHAVTNFLLALYVLYTRDWSFW